MAAPRGGFQSPTPGPAPDFELVEVAFSLARRVLLAPLSLTLHAGAVTGLIGHNGSGKSTLLKLLSRQLEPSSGQARFGGAPLAEWRPRSFAREVAYLPQHPPLAAGLSAAELVALGRYPWHGALGRFGAEDAEAVADAMALADVTAFGDRMVDELSGGERQRVWLAMLVAQRARWLLLDEPTSALDVAHQIDVLALVKRLSQERGVGVVVVLHDVNMAARFCDDLVALRAGRLIARGAPSEIVAREPLQRIYGLPMEVFRHPASGAPLAFAD